CAVRPRHRADSFHTLFLPKEAVMKFRSALPLLLLLLAVAVANAPVVHAHFTWLSTDDQGRVALFFGETPSERDYKLPEALAEAKVTAVDLEGKTSSVPVAKVDEEGFIGLRSDEKQAQSGIVVTECQYGNYHGTLLTYFAKHYVDDDPSAWTSEKLKTPLGLDAQAKQGEEGVQL